MQFTGATTDRKGLLEEADQMTMDFGAQMRTGILLDPNRQEARRGKGGEEKGVVTGLDPVISVKRCQFIVCERG